MRVGTKFSERFLAFISTNPLKASSVVLDILIDDISLELGKVNFTLSLDPTGGKIPDPYLGSRSSLAMFAPTSTSEFWQRH